MKLLIFIAGFLAGGFALGPFLHMFICPKPKPVYDGACPKYLGDGMYCQKKFGHRGAHTRYEA